MKNLILEDVRNLYGKKILLICCALLVFTLAWTKAFISFIDSVNQNSLAEPVFSITFDDKAIERLFYLDINQPKSLKNLNKKCGSK